MLKDFLESHWEEFIGIPTPKVMQLVPITSGTHDYGNDLILIFTDSCIHPAYVMKVSRHPSYSFKLEREFISLHYMNRLSALTAFIPTPYYLGHLSGRTFFIQKGLAGFDLSKYIGRYGLNAMSRQLLDDAIDLLVTINTASTDCQGETIGEFKISGNPLVLHEQEYIAAGIPPVKLEELLGFHRSFEERQKSFFLHGDYWLTNIIVNNRPYSISGIIDWEFSEPGSPVPSDIILFLIDLGHQLNLRLDPGKSLLDSYKWTLFAENDHSEFLKLCFQRYINAIEIDNNQFLKLLEFTLAKMAMRELHAYGKHGIMDYLYLDLFKYTVENEKEINL